MNLLRRIYEEIYGPIGGPNKQKNLTELSQRMARLSRRSEAWSYRALSGAMNEQRGFTVTHEMEVALQMIAAQLDQINPLQALLVEITAYSINGSVQPGSIITGHSMRCVCGTLFVPCNNFQKYCSKVCPKRPPEKNPKPPLKCAACGETTPRWSSTQRFCPKHSWQTPEGRKYQRGKRAASII